MFGIENERIISEEFEQYISIIVGSIDCGENKYIGDNIIMDIEQNRVENAKKGIVALQETYMSRQSNNKLSAIEFEILVRNFNLGVLQVTSKRISTHMKNTYERQSMSSGVRYDMENGIYKRDRYYYNKLRCLIKNTYGAIALLNDKQEPLYNFNADHITYRKVLNTFSNKADKRN